MSVENAKRFIEIAGKDQALHSKLGAARDSAELVRLAVQASSERDLPFTAEEFMASLQRPGGGGVELTDDQLEGVAGGLGETMSPSQREGMNTFLNSLPISELRELISKYRA